MAHLAEELYETEKFLVTDDTSDFEYDDDLDVFRFLEDGRFAFRDEFADWELLEAGIPGFLMSAHAPSHRPSR